MDHQEANLYCVYIPEEWRELIGNSGIITAILDRIIHIVEVIHLKGDNY
ncbi:ATP-binding protein [Priestia megaterium]|nr:ATP-binding protein [Priestia megaterium]MED4286426.1 ATP-binding protein [Priestia megaterium]